MTLEIASVKIVFKPWGKTDLRPWSAAGRPGAPIGELWFERADSWSPEPALLLKLLFTAQPLSIQVHPDDSYARSIGQPHGKTEAWYVLGAGKDAGVALGLERAISVAGLRTAIADGSIVDLVHWQHVVPGQAVLVQAGTIHAIGANLVVAEIQQRSAATFRMFDYERNRELHVEDAVAVALRSPAGTQTSPIRLATGRHLLTVTPYFVLERIDLPAHSQWELKAAAETWLLIVKGEPTFDTLLLLPGQAVFLENQLAIVCVRQGGVRLLVAYAADAPRPDLLRCLDADIAVQKPAAEELHV
jgi:mannose-6-phosphate isomerase